MKVDRRNGARNEGAFVSSSIILALNYYHVITLQMHGNVRMLQNSSGEFTMPLVERAPQTPDLTYPDIS